MRKRIQRYFTVFLVYTLILSVMPCHLFEGGSVQAEETVLASGTCGTNLTWTITEDPSVSWDVFKATPYKLTITGSGAMQNYPYNDAPTWYDYSNYAQTITTVSIGEGVTSIGNYAFQSSDCLMNLELPDSLKTIGNYAFQESNSLESVVIPDAVTSIGEYAFYNCKALESVTLGASVYSLANGVFKWCSSLKNVVMNDN